MLFLLALLALPSVAQSSVDTQASPLPDARFVRDLREKKIDDVLRLYTADAVFVQPDGTKVGGAALRKLYEQVTGALDSDLHLHAAKVERKGNEAVEAGAYSETLRHRDTGKTEDVHGSYRFAGRRCADGSWRFTRMEWGQ